MWSGDVKTQKASNTSFEIISMSLCTSKMKSHIRRDNRMRTPYYSICLPSAPDRDYRLSASFPSSVQVTSGRIDSWKSWSIFSSYKFERTEVYRVKGFELLNGKEKISTEAHAKRFPFFAFLFYTWNSISFKRCFIVRCAAFESRLSLKPNWKTFRRIL